MARIGISCYWLLLACILCLRVSECLSQKLQYDGFKVLRIIPRDQNELNALRSLQRSDNEFQVNFWTSPTRIDIPVDVMVSPDQQEDIIASFGTDRVEVIMKNVQEEIDRELIEQLPNPSRSKMTAFNFDYNRYHRLEDIDNWVSKITQTYEVATQGSIGFSYERRPIKYLKISLGEPKLSVLINGGLHPREWISPATVMYLTKYLVEGSEKKGSNAERLLNLFEFYIIPVLNPDGYVYSWTTDRFWRKTRKPNRKSNCVGTDGNRNFDIAWGDTRDYRSSSSPCHVEYHGSEPFSEPEVAALRDFVIHLGKANGNPGIALYIDYHSYSQLWLTPYGYTKRKPRNYTEQLKGAYTAAEALHRSHGTVYQVGDIYSTIYPVSGDSIDYMYDVQNITYSYVAEGRPGGDDTFYGFLLPANQIQATGEENWGAFVALCNFVAEDIGDVSNGGNSSDSNGGNGSDHGGGRDDINGNTNGDQGDGGANSDGNGNGNDSYICKHRKIQKHISRSSTNSFDKVCYSSTAVYNRRKWRKQTPKSLF